MKNVWIHITEGTRGAVGWTLVACPCLADCHGFEPGIYLVLFINTTYLVIHNFTLFISILVLRKSIKSVKSINIMFIIIHSLFLIISSRRWQVWSSLTFPVFMGLESVRRTHEQSKGVNRQIRYLIETFKHHRAFKRKVLTTRPRQAHFDAILYEWWKEDWDINIIHELRVNFVQFKADYSLRVYQ